MSSAAIIGGATLAFGAYQEIKGSAQKKAALKAAQNQQTPGYAPNKAVNDYYQSALNRYNSGAYNSTQYQVGKNSANQALGAGINALQSRRSGVQNIGALTGQYNNSLDRLGAQAEQTNRQNLQQLGQATGQKLGDDRFGYQQNQVAPYQKNLQLDYAQLGGANSLQSAGLSNISSGANTIGLAAMRNKFGPPQNNGWGFQ